MGNTYPLNISSEGTALSTSIFQLSVFPSLFFFHKIELAHLFLFSSAFSLLGIIYIKFFVLPDIEKEKQKENYEMKVKA